MNVTLRGKAFPITIEDVLHVTDGVEPGPLQRYAVRLHDQWYPPKQVLALLTGFPVAAFTTQDAYRTMQRLGLLIVDASSLTDDSETSS